MSKIVVENSSTFQELEKLQERIRRRSYELYLKRGESDGSATDDWLAAEQEIACAPEFLLSEDDRTFKVRIFIPQLGAEDMHVAALPQSLLVCGGSEYRWNENLRFCEPIKPVLKKLDMPAPIDVNAVTAMLERGVLQVTAAKQYGSQKETAAAVAA